MNESTTSKAIIDGLTHNGVEVVFGIPGTHNLPLYRHLGFSGIRHVTPRHEQGGGYAADAYSRTSGLPGVVITTSGPGLTNVVTAAATAYADSVPMLIISPGPPEDLLSREQGRLHEMKDQRAHMDAVVDMALRVRTPGEAAHAINDIFSAWRVGRTRPAYIEIPIDMMETPGEIPVLLAPHLPTPIRPRSTQLRSAAKAIAQATSRVIILGSGARNAEKEVTALAELLGCPVVTTVNGKGCFPEQHGLSLGASIKIRGALDLINDADVVVIVGATLGDAELSGAQLKPRGSVVRIDAGYGQLDLNVRATHKIWSEASLALAGLVEILNDDHLSEGVSENVEIVTQTRARISKEVLDKSPVYARIHDALLSQIPPDTIIVGDSAQVSYLGTAFHLRAQRYGQFLYPTRFATLGYGIPGGVGASLAAPTTSVMVLIGDGGAMFTIQEFATAVDLGLSLPVVIINNAGFEEIRQQMVSAGIDPLGVDVRVPDFPLLGKALGGEGVLLKSIDELGSAVRDALQRSVPTIIELRI
ncbi:thiamine pyrophosphate-binding protein [Microbacterium sp. zg.B48]|uniref:thiamine pyrophosphate-binding protein n=1 Tax=Microbacterium sp. zg.B48 TaxID=2969408 RepID=UPI00214BF099|nr:thiamine pyrophosphate-binding protein [Microbacterium sp. zg.B48]MCR2762476.1 thiamine pyrophosphate-binding protein [Microbacterium sp. zg.B48]